MAFLLERETVDPDFQKKLFEAGVNTVGKFAALVDTQAELRDLLKDEFGMDSRGGGLKVKATVAAILVAWASAKKRAEKKAELEGELDARGEPKPVGVTDALAMKAAFETRFWKLEDERTPSRVYLEKKLEQVEKNDLRAELLTEVLCQRDDADEVLKPVWDTAFTLKAVKVSKKIPAPANPEQLRRRLATMGAAWAFVAAAHPSRPYLQGVGMQIWTEYGDYLLGRYVLGMLGGVDGAALGDSDWQVVLDYEHEVRREMVQGMLAGTPLERALRAAWVDPVVKDRFLVTPLQRRTLAKRPAPPAEQSHNKKHKAESSGQGKANQTQGNGKGGGKQGGRKRPPRNASFSVSTSGCSAAMPTGTRICFAFNNKGEGCKLGVACQFAHVCGVCFQKDVPMFECKHPGTQ